MPTVRRLGAHEWSAYRDLRLRALGDAPDAFGTTLEAARRYSDAHWMERVSSGAGSRWDLALVTEEDGRLVGMVWGTIEPSRPGTAHVIQMWVAPESRGLGCGAMLLHAIIRWARDASARSVVLRVTCGDTPARRLYSRTGFEPVGEPEPIRPGSDLLAQPMRLVLSSAAPFERSTRVFFPPGGGRWRMRSVRSTCGTPPRRSASTRRCRIGRWPA